MSVTVGTIKTAQQAEEAQQTLLDKYKADLPDGSSIKALVEPNLNLETMRNPEKFAYIKETAQLRQRLLPENTQEVLADFEELENRRQSLLKTGADAGIASQPQPSTTIETPSFLDRMAAAAEIAVTEISDTLNEIKNQVNTWWKENSTSPNPEEPYGSTVSVGKKSNLRGEHFSVNANPSTTENPNPQGPSRSYIGYHFGGLASMNTSESKPPETPAPSAMETLTKYGVLSP